jgi:hypothetical protein
VALPRAASCDVGAVFSIQGTAHLANQFENIAHEDRNSEGIALRNRASDMFQLMQRQCAQHLALTDDPTAAQSEGICGFLPDEAVAEDVN